MGRSDCAVWVPEQDHFLLGVLREHKDGGFQGHNGGFRQDAFNDAADRLAADWQAKIRDDPSLRYQGPQKTGEMCKNRYSTLKTERNTVKTLQGYSGFGWDAQQGVVTAPPAVWAQLLASPGNKKRFGKWKTKSFPYMDDMDYLVDGQAATGAAAFHPAAGIVHVLAPTPAPAASHPPAPQADAESDEDEGGDEDNVLEGGLDNEANIQPSQPPPPSSAAPPHPTLPLSSSSTTPAPAPTSSIVRKRLHADQGPDDERPAKRAHRSASHGKGTNSDAAFAMADATRALALRFGMEDSNASPPRKAQAIAQIQADNQLSPTSLTRAFMLVCRETSVADIYTSITDMDRRTDYLLSEIDASPP
ncbi:hypothetical protein K523DRAFT_422228 [Schizophyllum commune Tattone D]|nr:hypothetical protein K523DRAFT_422228 [Schizophyllum commune Tattone D]